VVGVAADGDGAPTVRIVREGASTEAGQAGTGVGDTFDQPEGRRRCSERRGE
jgi:hypothetical protein